MNKVFKTVASFGKRLKARNIWYQGIKFNLPDKFESLRKHVSKLSPASFSLESPSKLCTTIISALKCMAKAVWMIWSVEMFKIKLTGSYYAINIKALNVFEQEICYFFSYRFSNVVHWKRRDRKREDTMKQRRRCGRSICINWANINRPALFFTYQSRGYNKPIARRTIEVH